MEDGPEDFDFKLNIDNQYRIKSIYMPTPISTTNSILLPTVYSLRHNTHNLMVFKFFKREIVSRVLAFSVIFFRSIDTVANFGAALAKSCERILRIRCRLQAPDDTSKKIIKEYFHASRDAVISDPWLFFKILFRPDQVASSQRKTSSVDTLLRINIETNHVTDLSTNDLTKPIDKPQLDWTSLDPDTLIEINHRKFAEEQLKTRTPESLDNKWDLDKLGHIYVLNLDRDKYRFQSVTNQLAKIGVSTREFQRFRAIHGAVELDKKIWEKIDDNSFNKHADELEKTHKGQAGCFMSHYHIIKDANENYCNALIEFNQTKQQFYKKQSEAEKCTAWEKLQTIALKVIEYSSIVVIEDDNGFGKLEKNNEGKISINAQGAGVIFKNAIKELPENWDMLYLMAEHGHSWNITPYSAHLHELHYGVCLNAYAINHTMYRPILNTLSRIEHPSLKVRPVDHEIASLHKAHKVFVLNPPIAYQGAGQSTISKGKSEQPWNGLLPRAF
jgi:GR25 family glycosyltransferase involved in LPS biosynthesis